MNICKENIEFQQKEVMSCIIEKSIQLYRISSEIYYLVLNPLTLNRNKYIYVYKDNATGSLEDL